jgi:hypothetical protein
MLTAAPLSNHQTGAKAMNEQFTDRPTPPKQTPDDPNVADRRLSDEQQRSMKDEPAQPDPAKRGKDEKLPNPKDVGEAG